MINGVDITLGILLALAFYSGFRKGLMATLAALVGLVLGVYAALYFSDYAGRLLAGWFDFSESNLKWISFVVTFLAVVFLANFVGKLLTKVANFTALGLLNKLLGGVLSVLQYAFILSVVFWFFNGSNLTGYVISEEKKENSLLYPYIAGLAPSIMPAIMEEYHEWKDQQNESPTEEPAETN